ncbi:hypothetical protein CD798_11795 [Bacillaceae bacterium SAOS 7]|nr:hypothetical protein CD798_11795 [Bacillaceae bacterium SAOS 7]
MNKAFQSKGFLVGFIGIILLLAVSIAIPFVEDGTNPSVQQKEDGTWLSAPYHPKDLPPFGSDKYGNSMFYKVMDGAKYTLSLMLVVSFLQVMLGLILAGILVLWGGRLKKHIYTILESFQYIPTIFLAIIFMMPMMMIELEDVSFPILLLQCMIIVLVMLPSVTVLIAHKIELIMKELYITASLLLGAGKYHLWRVHIWPFLKGPVIILFLQQCVQVCLLFIYLGFFNIYLGGQVERSGIEKVEHRSLSNEWSGLISMDRLEVFVAPWIVLLPVAMFSLTIFLLNVMKEGLTKN